MKSREFRSSQSNVRRKRIKSWW